MSSLRFEDVKNTTDTTFAVIEAARYLIDGVTAEARVSAARREHGKTLVWSADFTALADALEAADL